MPLGRIQAVYGIGDDSVAVMPPPFRARQDPTGRDKGSLGQVWINRVTNSIFQLVAIQQGSAQWSVPTSPLGEATAASPTAQVTINSRIGKATFTGFTTGAAPNSQIFTIVNNLATLTSSILITAGTETLDAFLTVNGYNTADGLFEVQVTNNGTAAVADSIFINFWILN